MSSVASETQPSDSTPEPPSRGCCVLTALGLALAAVGLAHLLYVPNFLVHATNDDTLMDWRARGLAYADRPDPHLLFMHIFLGRLLAGLSSLIAGVSWYRVQMVGAQFAASLVVYGLLLRRDWSARGAVLALLYLLCIDVPLYVMPQFTETASLAATAGLLIWMARTERGQVLAPGEWALSLGLFGLGTMIRVEAAQMILLLFGTGGAALVLGAVWSTVRAGQSWRQVPGPLIRLGLPPVCMLLSLVVLSQINTRAYARDPGYEQFFEYNRLAGEFVDYNHIVYDEQTRWIFDQVGWSANDLALMKSWAFEHPTIFALENLRTITTLFRQHRATLRSAEPGDRTWRARLAGGIARVRQTLRHTMGTARLGRVQFALIFTALLLGCSRRALPLVLLMIGSGLGLIAWLFLGWDRCPLRVHQSLVVAMALVSLVSAAGYDGWRRAPWILRSGRLVLIGGLLVGGLEIQRDLQRLSARALRNDEVVLAAIRSIPPGPDRLVVGWGQALPLYRISYRAAVSDALRDLRFYQFTGACRTPLDRARLAGFGIRDLYRALYTRADVTVFCRPEEAELLAEFAREHHGETVTYREQKFVIEGQGPTEQSFSRFEFTSDGSDQDLE